MPDVRISRSGGARENWKMTGAVAIRPRSASTISVRETRMRMMSMREMMEERNHRKMSMRRRLRKPMTRITGNIISSKSQ